MPLVPLLLLIGVEMVAFRLDVKYVIFIALLPRPLLDLVHLALRMLLQLVVQGHKQVTLPDVKLSLQRIVLANS